MPLLKSPKRTSLHQKAGPEALAFDLVSLEHRRAIIAAKLASARNRENRKDFAELLRQLDLQIAANSPFKPEP